MIGERELVRGDWVRGDWVRGDRRESRVSPLPEDGADNLEKHGSLTTVRGVVGADGVPGDWPCVPTVCHERSFAGFGGIRIPGYRW